MLSTIFRMRPPVLLIHLCALPSALNSSDPEKSARITAGGIIEWLYRHQGLNPESYRLSPKLIDDLPLS